MGVEGSPSARGIDLPGNRWTTTRDSGLLWKEWWGSLSGQEADDARRWGLEPGGELLPDQVGLFWNLQVEIRRTSPLVGASQNQLGRPAPALFGGARLLQQVVPWSTRIFAEKNPVYAGRPLTSPLDLEGILKWWEGLLPQTVDQIMRSRPRDKALEGALEVLLANRRYPGAVFAGPPGCRAPSGIEGTSCQLPETLEQALGDLEEAVLEARMHRIASLEEEPTETEDLPLEAPPTENGLATSWDSLPDALKHKLRRAGVSPDKPSGMAQLLENVLELAETSFVDDEGSQDLRGLALAVPQLGRLGQRAKLHASLLDTTPPKPGSRRMSTSEIEDPRREPSGNYQLLSALAIGIVSQPWISTSVEAITGGTVGDKGFLENQLFRAMVLGDPETTVARIREWNTISDRWHKHRDIVWPDFGEVVGLLEVIQDEEIDASVTSFFELMEKREIGPAFGREEQGIFLQMCIRAALLGHLRKVDGPATLSHENWWGQTKIRRKIEDSKVWLLALEMRYQVSQTPYDKGVDKHALSNLVTIGLIWAHLGSAQRHPAGTPVTLGRRAGQSHPSRISSRDKDLTVLLPLFVGRRAELRSDAWFQEEAAKALQDKTRKCAPASKKSKSTDRPSTRPSDPSTQV